MANLIQVQDDLKNLSDEELQQATQTPTGSAPPFMLMAEANRRKNMRAAYEGEQARQRENQTTVMEDLTGGGPPPGAMPPGAMPPPAPPMGPPLGGLPALAPQAFANGGLVGGGAQGMSMPGLSEIAAMQNSERADMRNMALLQAGLQIMGGTSPHAAQNIALAAPAIGDYQRGMRESIQDQLGLMRAGAQYEQDERAAALRNMQFDFQQREAARQAADAARRIEIQERQATRPPAAVQTYEYFKGLSPEDQAAFSGMQQSTRAGPSDLTIARQQSQAFVQADSAARKEATEQFKYQPDATTESKDAWVAQRRNELLKERYPFWYDEMSVRFSLGSAPTSTQTAPGGVSIVDAPPEGATIQSLTDPLLYGSD